MGKARAEIIPSMKNSIDYYNFCTADNKLPILEIINERFARSFRVSLSNYLRMITTFSSSSKIEVFSEWSLQNKQTSCMFIIRLKNLKSPILIKLNRALSYGIIDALAGGVGKEFEHESDKEFTMIDLTILKDIADLIISDLNQAWAPVEEIKAQYVRTEINAQFIGIIPPASKVIVVGYSVELNSSKGEIEVLYPYSTLYSVRDKLFNNGV